MRTSEVAEGVARGLLRSPLLRRAEVLRRPSPVPSEAGIYAWYFDEVPPCVPVEGCHRRDGATLLYVGISPSRQGTKQTLRKRIHTHLRGNASSSTLRLSLGCLLTKRLGIDLLRIRTRIQFGPGEATLNDWLDRNASVCWHVHPEPWLVERDVIAKLDLPLNLEHNEDHPFAHELSDIRKKMKARAKRP